MGFVDVGFLRAEGSKSVLGKRSSSIRLDCTRLVAWVRRRAELEDATFLRAYWYDGAVHPGHPRFEEYFEFRPLQSQKGVDTLLVLDLVRLAQNGACHTALLFTGDRDIAEAVRTA
jgi:hypothetical protein